MLYKCANSALRDGRHRPSHSSPLTKSSHPEKDTSYGTMEDDRELAGYGDGGLPGADPPRQTRPPGLQRRPARDTMEDDPGRLVQVGAQQLVAAAGDVAGVVLLAGLVAPRRQADVGPDTGRLGKALRRIHDADVGERDQDADTRCGHQPPCRLVLPGHGHEPAAEHRDLLA